MCVKSKPYPPNVQVKVLYAISCTLRASTFGLKTFIDQRGPHVIHVALSKTNVSDKFIQKASFFLGAMVSGTDVPDGEGVNETKQIRTMVLEAGLLQLYVRLFKAQELDPENYQAFEQLTNCLVAMVRDIPSAASFIQDDNGLKQAIIKNQTRVTVAIREAPDRGPGMEELKMMLQDLNAIFIPDGVPNRVMH